MLLVDTHAHLNDERLIAEADGIIKGLRSDGLGFIINVGYDAESSKISVGFADKYKDVYASVGCHPHNAKDATEADFDAMVAFASNPKVVALGEMGLDYHYDLSDRPTQKRVFVRQLELANTLKLPVIIHMRDATADMTEILRENRALISNGGVFHCYSGSAETVRELAFTDFYFALGGAITYTNANKDDVIRAIPSDRLLIETDCPYMTPVPYRGQTNYPRYIVKTFEKISSTLCEEPERLSERLMKNTKTLFRKCAKWTQ